jgi:hypothetical protein
MECCCPFCLHDRDGGNLFGWLFSNHLFAAFLGMIFDRTGGSGYLGQFLASGPTSLAGALSWPIGKRGSSQPGMHPWTRAAPHDANEMNSGDPAQTGSTSSEDSYAECPHVPMSERLCLHFTRSVYRPRSIL